ncbi:hypothetical protein V3C99_013179 [Haemonchus contortus]
MTYATNNFVYRYIQLCRPKLLHIYQSPKGWLVVNAITSFILLNWVAMLYIVIEPSPMVKGSVRNYVTNNYDVDPNDKASFGLSVKLITVPELILLNEMVLVVMAIFTVGGVCAWRIDRCLRKNAMSPQTKKVQRHMFIMLTLQTLNPALLLNAPLYSVYICILVCWRHHPCCIELCYRFFDVVVRHVLAYHCHRIYERLS